MTRWGSGAPLRGGSNRYLVPDNREFGSLAPSFWKAATARLLSSVLWKRWDFGFWRWQLPL
jgi:hypothetical protein